MHNNKTRESFHNKHCRPPINGHTKPRGINENGQQPQQQQASLTPLMSAGRQTYMLIPICINFAGQFNRLARFQLIKTPARKVQSHFSLITQNCRRNFVEINIE